MYFPDSRRCENAQSAHYQLSKILQGLPKAIYVCLAWEVCGTELGGDCCQNSCDLCHFLNQTDLQDQLRLSDPYHGDRLKTMKLTMTSCSAFSMRMSLPHLCCGTCAKYVRPQPSNLPADRQKRGRLAQLRRRRRRQLRRQTRFRAVCCACSEWGQTWIFGQLNLVCAHIFF